MEKEVKEKKSFSRKRVDRERQCLVIQIQFFDDNLPEEQVIDKNPSGDKRHKLYWGRGSIYIPKRENVGHDIHFTTESTFFDNPNEILPRLFLSLQEAQIALVTPARERHQYEDVRVKMEARNKEGGKEK